MLIGCFLGILRLITSRKLSWYMAHMFTSVVSRSTGLVILWSEVHIQSTHLRATDVPAHNDLC